MAEVSMREMAKLLKEELGIVLTPPHGVYVQGMGRYFLFRGIGTRSRFHLSGDIEKEVFDNLQQPQTFPGNPEQRFYTSEEDALADYAQAVRRARR